MIYYKKITRVNGFDSSDRDNARQNNYAWSMAELDGYLYIGTGRNVVYRGMLSLEMEPTRSFTPEHPSQASEIWRLPIRGCGHPGEWERVYQMPAENGTCLFRCMASFRDSAGENRLHGGSYSKDGQGYLLNSKDGLNWESVPFPLEPGYYVRPIMEHKGKLYAASCQPLTVGKTTYLHVYDDPVKGWRRVDTGPVTGEIFSMTVFNGQLYIGTMPAGGFAIWKSSDPESGRWECVVDKGAGDALNEIPMAMEEFGGWLYVGSGINGAIYSTDPDSRWVLPKGFDLIRISPDDDWEVIVGGTPILPTTPSRGTRNEGLYSAGFGNMFNPYCWTLKKYGGHLFVGSWDSAVLYKFVLEDLAESGASNDYITKLIKKILREMDPAKLADYNYGHWLKEFLHSLRNYPESLGFDCLISCDGKHFRQVSMDGFRNDENYGIRNMLEVSDGRLYVGTANPTQGCEIWTLSIDHCPSY